MYEPKYSTTTAFFLWITCVFGLCGIHRFYLGRPVSGFFYLITFGFLGIGQIIDLVRLRRLVDDENLRHEALLALAERRGLEPGRRLALPAADPESELRIALTRAAAARGGHLSVAQAVIDIGRDFKEVEAALDAMAHDGYVDYDNDESGAVVYTFGGLAKRPG